MTINEKRLTRNGTAVALECSLAGFPLIYSLVNDIALSPLSTTNPDPGPGERGQWQL